MRSMMICTYFSQLSNVIIWFEAAPNVVAFADIHEGPHRLRMQNARQSWIC